MQFYKVLSQEVAKEILGSVNVMDWSVGQARTKELTGTVKQNKEILHTESDKAQLLLRAIAKKIMAHNGISLDCIPLMISTPKFSKYTDGEHYKVHTDSPWMGTTRTDLSCTLFLSDPSTYEGGELCVDGNKIKGQQGEIAVYECGKPHEVIPVTKGERVCVVTWIQSRIRDKTKRKIISDFRKWLAKMEDNEKLFFEGNVIYSSLLRRWME